ncbi:hypothetical protein F5Y13DRAFT_152250 [Hypoxylon sp. FL1857]|nr:hypothetical protein F5Y13DRAFT_152250 [Hypoxylon sp. FL1857]
MFKVVRRHALTSRKMTLTMFAFLSISSVTRGLLGTTSNNMPTNDQTGVLEPLQRRCSLPLARRRRSTTPRNSPQKALSK